MNGKEASDYAVKIVVTNPAVFRPATTEIAILCHLKKAFPQRFRFMADEKKERLLKFDKAMGTSLIRRAIEAGWDYRTIMQTCNRSVAAHNFMMELGKYLIYR